ncbi:hypothetical protein [Maricaulis sp.]|uniref:hypothetical protein n=1 Tax=Maricaulis sp. TaxID=1486257 RepID=UPI003A91A9D9
MTVLNFIADIMKPALTIAVTVILILVAASVFSPEFNIWIQGHLPIWHRLDGMVEAIREWLGIAREERPWWQFWG